jgi:NADPH:quinone reductase-like Zn-dependent oxidoreductase
MIAAWYDRQGAPGDVLQVGELPAAGPGPGEIAAAHELIESGRTPGRVLVSIP